MREFRSSGSVEGVVCKHDSYSDSFSMLRGYSRWLPTVFIRRRMRVQSERFFAHSAFPANARRLENE